MLSRLELGPVTFDDNGLQPPLVAPLVAAAKDGGDLMPVVRNVLDRYGYDHFMYAVALSLPPLAETRQWVFTTLPDAWLAYYDQHDFIECDPRVRHAVASQLPLCWDRSTFVGIAADTDRFLDAAAQFGVGSGLSFSTRGGMGGGGAMVAFSSASIHSSPARRLEQQQHMGDLMVWSAFWHDSVMRGTVAAALSQVNATAGGGLLGAPVAEGAKLSPQQVKTVQLTAEGVNGKRLAALLGIEPRSLHYHWVQIRTKLNAKSREEAMAKAVALGIIKMKRL